MAIKDALLPEFDHEMATTRTLLAIVPEQHHDWLPHPKSYTLGRLAAHIANLPAWLSATMITELDLKSAAAWTPPEYSTTLANVAYFDSMVTKARDSLSRATDADFMVRMDAAVDRQGQPRASEPPMGCGAVARSKRSNGYITLGSHSTGHPLPVHECSQLPRLMNAISPRRRSTSTSDHDNDDDEPDLVLNAVHWVVDAARRPH